MEIVIHIAGAIAGSTLAMFALFKWDKEIFKFLDRVLGPIVEKFGL